MVKLRKHDHKGERGYRTKDIEGKKRGKRAGGERWRKFGWMERMDRVGKKGEKKAMERKKRGKILERKGGTKKGEHGRKGKKEWGGRVM